MSSASIGSSLPNLFTLSDDGNPDGLAGALGQNHSGSELLIGIFRINPQPDVGLCRLSELSGGGFLQQSQSFLGFRTAGLQL